MWLFGRNDSGLRILEVLKHELNLGDSPREASNGSPSVAIPAIEYAFGPNDLAIVKLSPITITSKRTETEVNS
jgi:hypothetical protein